MRLHSPSGRVLLATLALGSLCFAGYVVADDMPAPKDKPADGDALPAPSKPADPAKPADPVKPAEPAAPVDPKVGETAPKAEPAKAPDFTLKDIDGKDRKLSEFAGKYIVLEWTNYSCPFVKKHYGPGSMQALQKTYTDKGVIWLSICSSAEGKEGYQKPEDWKKAVAEAKAVPTAVLTDYDGTVGRLYGARVTPEMRIVCPKGTILYSGAIDDNPSKKSDPKEAKNYIAEVLDAVLAGKDAPVTETKAYG